MATFSYLAMDAKRHVYLQCNDEDTHNLNGLRSYLGQQATSASETQIVSSTCSAVL